MENAAVEIASNMQQVIYKGASALEIPNLQQRQQCDWQQQRLR